MSTRDPDNVRRAIGARLQPFAVPASLIGVVAGPIIALLFWAAGMPEGLGPVAFTAVVLITASAGLLLYLVPDRPGPLAIAAYSFAFLGGLLAVLASGSISNPTVPVSSYLLLAGAYLIAITLAVLHWLRTQAVKLTAERGIATTGTVTRARVDGMVNHVEHQRLTVTFTDNAGVQRWLRVGKVGGGYSVGDTLPVRYDPGRPWSKRSIIVGN